MALFVNYQIWTRDYPARRAPRVPRTLAPLRRPWATARRPSAYPLPSATALQVPRPSATPRATPAATRAAAAAPAQRQVPGDRLRAGDVAAQCARRDRRAGRGSQLGRRRTHAGRSAGLSRGEERARMCRCDCSTAIQRRVAVRSAGRARRHHWRGCADAPRALQEPGAASSGWCPARTNSSCR